MGIGRTRLIAVAGGSGSCKTTFSRKLAERLNGAPGAWDGAVASVLYQDSYYIDQSARFKEDGGEVNFDHPSALDWKLMAEHLEALKQGRAVEVPEYDFATHKRKLTTHRLDPKPVILVDGILILCPEAGLTRHFDEIVFMDMPESLRFERRFKRDTVERGRSPEGVKRQWALQVKPMHDRYVQPSSATASRIIHSDAELLVVLEEMLKHLP